MQFTLQAIVLQCVKYGENSRVVKCYTDLFGLQSYIVNGVKSKKGVLRPGMLLPLTQLNLVASHKAMGTMERIKEASVAFVYEQIPTDPVRNALALFVAEVLIKCLKIEQGDADKFDFVVAMCRYLDVAPHIPAHFPQYFLVEFSKHLGFYPNYTNQPNCLYFDCVEGVFCALKPLHPYYFSVESTAALRMLMKNIDEVENLKINKAQRKQLLRDLLMFYRSHISNFGQLKTLEVFEEVFS